MSKMKSVMVLVATSLLIVVFITDISPVLGSGTQGSSLDWQPVTTGPTIFVVPDQLTVFENHTYIVNVRLNDVVDLAGWQFELYWNSAMLRCLNATVNTPVEWGGVGLDLFNKTEADANSIDSNSMYTAWQFGSGIDNNYDATHGRYFKAECYGPNGGPYHNTFNGSMSLVTLTFNATRSGTTTLTLGDTLLGDSSASAIEHTTLSGSKALLVSGVTEAPKTPDEPVKDNNQTGLETNGTIPPNATASFSDNVSNLTEVTCTMPIEVFSVNLTVTPPLEAFPNP